MTFRRAFPFCIALGLVMFAVASRAEAAESSSSAEPAPARSVSLTTDPTRAIFGVGAVSAELRAAHASLLPGLGARDVSIVGMVGMGYARVADGGVFGGVLPVWQDCNAIFHCDRATVLTVGVQALLYPVGTFRHGMQLGLDASYTRYWGTRSYVDFAGAGEAIAAANNQPFRPIPNQDIGGGAFYGGLVIGYKLVVEPGVTLNPQAVMDVSISDEPVKLVPRLALNAGWSF